MGTVVVLWLGALLASLCGTCSAGPLGKEFITVFTQNYELSFGRAEFKLYISGYNSSTTVSVAINRFSIKPFVIDKKSYTIQVPAKAALGGPTKLSYVIVIKADKLISVASLSYKVKSADTSIVYPIEDLGKDYYVVTPVGGIGDDLKEVSVVSCEEPTNVDIFLTGAVTYREKTYAAGSKLTVLLEPYSDLQLLSKDNLSGTHIVSQKPVVVMSGHTCTQENNRCNHVYEQLLPVSSWGTSFIIPPISVQLKSDIVFVVAAVNTKIEYQIQTTRSSQNLNLGQVIQLEVPIRTPIYLSASAGIQVLYYCTGWQDNSFIKYNPTFVTIPPVSSYCFSYNLFAQEEFENYGNLVMKKADVSKVSINKNPIEGLTWNEIPGTDYSWATLKLVRGLSTNILENPSSPFLLLSCGSGKPYSYGSPAVCIDASSDQFCGTLKCTAKEKCQLSNGKPICVPDSVAYCHSVGDPHYRTFDGYYYDFQGTCTYTIAKTCGSDSSLPAFNIETKNENHGNTRVSYVSYVTVQVYDYSISLVRYEYGFVRVNNQRLRLPMNLNEGRVYLYQSGDSVVIETDFALKVYYDWNSVLKVSISSIFSQKVCGLCGNYNGNPSDDLMTPTGTLAPNLVEFGRSWKVDDGDRVCWHNCNGECKTCRLELQQIYASEKSCGLISKVLDGPFSQCHSVIDPKPYLDNCVYDLCMNEGYKQILCQSLKTYADACQRNKSSIGDWRQLSGCLMPCTENSEYKLCAQACPATCNDDAKPSICSESCVESCQCKAGYVLDEGKCIPKASCGCNYQGKLYAPNEKFWDDRKCEKQCICNPSTKKVECKATKCKSSEKCSVTNGIQNCYPVSYGTCSTSGDPHYVTFDGARYDFQGTCIYQFAGLCKKSDDLVDFQVNVQNENRGSKVVSYVLAVNVKICSFDIMIDRNYKGRFLLNGVLTNLPFVIDNGKLSIYKQGFHGVIQTSFGLRVSYNWDNHVAVTLPSSYAGAVCGLCGNFDNDKKNDFLMKNNQLTMEPTLFANSWKVKNVPGCYEADGGLCSNLAELERLHNNNNEGCGIIKDKNGPFRECHAKINPEGYFKSCVYDACFYEGRQEVLCKMIASYATLCQEAGFNVSSWRTSKFCGPACPKNSHYEVCASGCAPTCLSLSPPLGCKPGCSEGCECDDGFILSGGDCVPISQCGCKYNDKYYKAGEVFFPSGLCNQQCVCTTSGAVECKAFICGPNEECKVMDGVQKCYPVGSAQCFTSGDPHYMSFDGVAYDFQGNCTYSLTKTISKMENVVPFVINVNNEKWGNGMVTVTKLVSFEVYGYKLILEYEVRGKILVDGVYRNLPVNLGDGKIRVYQHGIRVLIDTDFGVQVNYDLVYHVIVTVPGNYKDQLGGLCGNYNGDRKDDFQLPDKTVTTDATKFGASWKVQIPGITCDDGCGGIWNPCPLCDPKKQEIFKTENFCGFLKKPDGPLSACFSTINPDPYFNNCIYDLCATVGDGDILCQSIHSYVATCQAAGIIIQPWRTDSFCPLLCPANSTYKVCAKVCELSCASVSNPVKCPGTCSEGCECDNGYFFDGKNCVSFDRCGSVNDTIYCKPDDKYLTPDCKQVCTCGPNGLVCENFTCAANEICKINAGAVVCIKKDPCKSNICKVKETCKIIAENPVCVADFTGTCWAWGDPHYHTFDGYDYDFQGTCTYILAHYGGGDPGLQPFQIEEKNDNRGSQAVSYVRSVTMYFYKYKITIMKGEFGKVRVNDVITNLPVTLLNGKISAKISGLDAVVQTDFGLKVTYEYNSNIMITLSSSYYGLTKGLCGNFNQNIKDERITSDDEMVTSIIDWAKSWKIYDRDRFCFDVCPELNCPTCDEEKKSLYEDEKKCGLIKKDLNGPFRECHPKLDPANFFDSCLYDVCINDGANQILCQALGAYANTCRKQGIKIYDWRSPSGCVLPCPANSHYESCGNACPATCTDRTAPSRCAQACVETCQCNDGLVLSGGKCVPIAECGCSYKGAYYQANQEFWDDDKCQRLCKCDTSVGFVTCKESSCKSSERCFVINGVRRCQPTSFSTCTGSGDPHYTTFDGKRFDFMGTCIYQLVGVTSTNPSMPRFRVTVQNYNRGGNAAISYTKVVNLEVYDMILTLSLDFSRRILVNGVVTSLPFYYQTNKVVAFISGSQGIIKTDFEVTITFDWNNYVSVRIPSTYENAIGGLCGNFNNNPNDDFTMMDGRPALNSAQFGNRWKVGDVPGCSSECTRNCVPLCSEAQKQEYKAEQYCGLITNRSGPFSQCYPVVDPTPFFNDCIFDACQYKGHPSSFCNSISLYVAACQVAGIKLQEWRSESFCSLSCPPNTHYELCGNACPVTCHGLSPPTGCDSPCKEACYCDNGYVLSGHKCVPIASCGCVYQDKYYQQNEIFYPKGQCSEKCQCDADGIVRCKSEACGPEEECKLANGAWGCQPKEYDRCVVSGDAHYISFDGLRYDFQGTCTYILSKVVADYFGLVRFSVTAENEGYGNGRVSVTKRVVVSVYGYTIAMERGMRSKVKVDGELNNLPLVLDNDNIIVTQEGLNVILQTNLGLKVLYDAVFHVILVVPSTYRGKLGGLCGNYNGDRNDEFQLPNKQVVKNVNEFGLSWKVNIAGAKCSDGCKEGECPVCADAKLQLYKATSSCGMITNPSGPFKACHSKINPDHYFNYCIYDSCAVDGKDEILCKSLQAYAAACHAVEVMIGSWRTPTFCALSCPANSHYELCTRMCEQTCSGLSAPVKCTDQCFEGCECNAGYVMDGDKCVTADKCGCVTNGRYLSEGESVISANCTRQCKCQAGLVDCTDIKCGDKERCGLRNGVNDCYMVEGECSMNALKFVSFDGLSGGPVGNGPVEVASLCDNKAAGWFRIVADIQSCGRTMSSVATLHIYQGCSIVTISKDQEVWVNGRLDSLPVDSGMLSAKAGASLISIQIGASLRIALTDSGDLVLRVSERLSELICGACGNFNRDLSDDLKSPAGKSATDVSQLLASWRSRDLSSCNASNQGNSDVSKNGC